MMTYFFVQPSACVLYARCQGWQETLAHFFVRSYSNAARRSLDHFLSIETQNEANASRKSSSTGLDSIQKSRTSTSISMDYERTSIDTPSPIIKNATSSSNLFDFTASPRDASENQLVDGQESLHNTAQQPIQMTPPESCTTSQEDIAMLSTKELPTRQENLELLTSHFLSDHEKLLDL